VAEESKWEEADKRGHANHMACRGEMKWVGGGRRKRERDLDRERSDLDLETEEQQERGLSPEEARRAAR
jgi:hypothetical protein